MRMTRARVKSERRRKRGHEGTGMTMTVIGGDDTDRRVHRETEENAGEIAQGPTINEEIEMIGVVGITTNGDTVRVAENTSEEMVTSDEGNGIPKIVRDPVSVTGVVGVGRHMIRMSGVETEHCIGLGHLQS